MRPTPQCSKKQGGRRWTSRLTDLFWAQQLRSQIRLLSRSVRWHVSAVSDARFKPVTLPALLRQGACEFAWVNPKEEPTILDFQILSWDLIKYFVSGSSTERISSLVLNIGFRAKRVPMSTSCPLGLLPNLQIWSFISILVMLHALTCR